MAHNIIAEIAGSDPKAGYVHFDSWIAGDGASDNGSGSVAVTRKRAFYLR